MWSAGMETRAQQPPQTGPQTLAFAGLRSALSNQNVPVGQINAVQVDAQGDLVLLLDQKDGVRLLKTDATAANLLAQALIGAQGDIGLAMALDPAGNIYVTGTSTSGAMIGTTGTPFPASIANATNAFVAKFDSGLNPQWISFGGASAIAPDAIAATGDSVFITGSIFSSTLPVTPSAIGQFPATGSTQNGFVENFSADGTNLKYATYLSAFNGNVMPAGIAADASDNAYVVGATTSSGFPTVAALVPAILGSTSGFLTRLNSAGSGIVFSTYVPGAGVTSIAIDAGTANLLLSGAISLGQFAVTTVTEPLAPTTYQTLIRMPLDGSAVLQSTLLAPGTQSYVAPGPSGTAWVVGNLTLPLFPLQPLQEFGSSFAVHVNSSGLIDETARFGGTPTTSPSNASAPVTLTGVAPDASGNAVLAGSFQPSSSEALLPAITYDLPLENAPTNAFPSTVRSAVISPAACNGGLCSGSAAYLARLTVPANASAATASLALSIDDSPNLTLRNLGSAEAAGVQIAVTGFTSASNCETTLPAGAECAIELSGSGPGTITVSAANASTQTQSLPALASGITPLPVVFAPKELDFGIVSSVSGPVTQTITVTNLSQQAQTFASALDANPKATLPYTIAETASDCAAAGDGLKTLPAGATCHITLGITASSSPSNDGAVHTDWLIGTHDVLLTAYSQAAQLSVSSPQVDFGTQYVGGLKLQRYLYLSNNSTETALHTAVELPYSSPFSVTDGCPGVLEPLSVCQLKLAYQSAQSPSSDSVTLALDQGLTTLLTGTTLPQPSANGASANPNLSVSAEALNFPTPVVVTGISSTTQSITLTNTGASPFSLALTLAGDFTDTTNCGASLSGHTSCNVVLAFAPSQPGTRQGLLAVTAGANTTPAYVTLSGVGTAILSPPNNGSIAFGEAIVEQPIVTWIKVTQPFTTLTATVTGPSFGLVRVEDIGYGHGQPSIASFGTTATGTCYNCWLGVVFEPTAIGLQTGTLTLTSSAGGNAYVLSLTGTGLPQTGLLLTPATVDFGPVPLHSSSDAQWFTVTNLVQGGASVTLSAPATTGDFTISNPVTGGSACGGSLPYTASCVIAVAFTPTTLGTRAGTLTLQTGSTTSTASLLGYGQADPGVALSPTALTFRNVPDASATRQTVTVTNTSAAAEQIGIPVATTAGTGPQSFSVTTNCSTLAVAASCTVTAIFTPVTGPASGTLTIPVTQTSSGGDQLLTNLTVQLTGAYTTQNAGLEIVPGTAEYGPQTIGSAGLTRQFTINNLTTKTLALNVALPRQFALTGAPCTTVMPNGNCSFSVTFLPLTNGDITGTITAQGTPTDNSAAVNGLAYVEGYGAGTAMLAISGGLQPGEVLNFGQVPSGQSATRILTLTNAATATPLTVRRVTSNWPFLSTTTCGATMLPGGSCTVTLNYTPVNQAATGSNPPPTSTDNGLLTIESDAVSSPDLVNLTGTSTPVLVGSPSNAGPVMTLTASPASISFADTAVGTASAPQAITLTNTGTASITVSGVQSSPDFAATTNCATLIAGATCSISVVFTPQPDSGRSVRPGAIEISSNANTSLDFASLTGLSSPSTISLSSGTLDFSTVLVGATAMLPVTITNNATSSASLNSYTATGDYSVAAGTCPQPSGTLAAGASCTLQVTFAPSQGGTRTGTLSIATSAAPLPLGVALTGVGAQSQLQITPSALAFGSVNLGSSASLSLTLKNAGATSITGIALTTTGDYAITAPCGTTVLAVGASCSVTIAFTPIAPGGRQGTLTVTSSDPGSPAAIPLSGTALPAGSFTLTVNGANTGSATVASGSPASYSLVVTPANGFAGNVVLNCTPVTPAQYATCSLLPSSVMLTTGAQNSAATINTVTTTATNAPGPLDRRNVSQTALALLFPALLFTWKVRPSQSRARRRIGLAMLAIFATALLMTSSACGGHPSSPGISGPTNLRYTPAGSYQYQVTASGTSGGNQITQTVTLNLIVH